jgi:serine/threonine-protein kinase HipA
MHKKKNYPDRKALMDFGRTTCRVMRPDTVIERIATAMEETLREGEHRVDDWLFARMKDEWRNGMSA